MEEEGSGTSCWADLRVPFTLYMMNGDLRSQEVPVEALAWAERLYVLCKSSEEVTVVGN